MKNLILISTFLLCILNAYASDTIQLDEKRIFKDGIYMSYEDMKYDRPTYPFIGIKVLNIDSNQFHLQSIYKIQVKNKKGKYKTIALKDVWGICYKGKPYINYRGKLGEAGGTKGDNFFMQDMFGKEVLTFFRVVTIGRYCVFTVEGNTLGYNMNTMTNKPYQDKYQFVSRKILDMDNGKISELNFQSAMYIIERDEFVKEMFDDNPISEALDKYIYVYNIRNPYRITVPEPITNTSKKNKKKKQKNSYSPKNYTIF